MMTALNMKEQKALTKRKEEELCFLQLDLLPIKVTGPKISKLEKGANTVKMLAA
jgi:hypothetical protein